jgi:hypothetical protein
MVPVPQSTSVSGGVNVAAFNCSPWPITLLTINGQKVSSSIPAISSNSATSVSLSMSLGSSNISIAFNGNPSAWSQYVSLPQGTPSSSYALWLYYDGYILTVDGIIRDVYWQRLQLMIDDSVGSGH